MQTNFSKYSTKSLLESYGLNMTTVSWEDTARTKNSCWGPNISDMTLYSNNRNCNVLRRPNFADVTVDHSMDNFFVTVGNENNSPLKKIKLSEYLCSLKELKMEVKNDEKLLCSTQACILRDQSDSNETCFNVRLYNYQTTTENPAVLVIISTNQGTSAQILNSKTTDVLFNKNGKAHDFVAERLKEERKRLNKNTDEPMTSEEKERNVIFVYQIPLVVPKRENKYPFFSFDAGEYLSKIKDECEDSCEDSCEESCEESCEISYQNELFDCIQSEVNLSDVSKKRTKGFDNAMLKVSSNDKGEFTGLKGKNLERDSNFPIRCTLQYYYLNDTNDTDIPESLVQTISTQLNKFYDNSENKSSLVVTNTDRPTEPKIQIKSTNSFVTGLLNKFI